MPDIKITATDFYQFKKCPQIVYLNRFGDQSKKKQRSEFSKKKMEDGIDHERDFVSALDVQEVPVSSNEEAAFQTIKWMKDGVELIYQGVLIKEGMVGKPDLLKKIEGPSKLGDYHYIPLDIKSGKNLKAEYKLQVMFYAELLESIQGVFPKKAVIINSEKTELEFQTKKEREEYNLIKEELYKTVQGKEQEPAFFSFCKECEWEPECMTTLQETKDLTLVFKLSRKVKNQLKELGINNLGDLAEASEQRLCEIKGIGTARARRWKIQARSILNKEPIVLKKPKLAQHQTEIFFDIEGETELAIDYLYGCLVKTNNSTVFTAFWADTPDDEQKMWEQFLEFFRDLKDPVMYHYSSYEKTSLKRMKQRYGCDKKTWGNLMGSLVDLMPLLQESAVLPLSSYSIKPVAKYLGFQWREKKAGGAQSLFWYAKYLKGEKELKKTILEYNEDDVKATKVLKDWLKNLKV